MTTMARGYLEETIEVAGLKTHMLRGVEGTPLLLLHHDVGNPGWLPFYEILSRRYALFVPSHPGFGQSERPDWARSVRDLAMLYNCLLKDLRLTSIPVVGLGFGGWIAAEMAVMCHDQFSRMVLVNPMGVQPLPGQGEILDQFLISTLDYVRAGFVNQSKCDALYGNEPDVDQLVRWEINREMTTRIAYKPYMFDQQLPYLLKAVDIPTLIVCGDGNKIVPMNCAQRYKENLRNSDLRVIEGSGHFTEVEQPEALAALVRDFLVGSADTKRHA